MTNVILSEAVGQAGVFSLLNDLLQKQEPLSVSAFEMLTDRHTVGLAVTEDLFRRGLVVQHDDAVSLSTVGQKTALLLRSVNDKEELGDTFQKLSVIYPYLRPFHLVEGNITEYVVDLVNARRDFIRLFLCSPWIRLKEPLLDRLKAAVAAARQRYGQLQILVITLPLDRYRDPQGIATVRELQQLGATVALHRKLHAKLYISQPGPEGGTHYAVFGSENLTGANQVELAIKVENDNEMLTRLASFFFEIEQESSLLPEAKP